MDRGRGGRARRVREAQGRSLAVRLARARGERRGRRERPAAASCRTSRPRTRSTRRSPTRSTSRASSPASCSSRSSRHSAGTSSRSCTARPTSIGRTPSRRRSTAAPSTFADAARDNSDKRGRGVGRRHGLGRQGPAGPRARGRDLRAPPIGKVSDPLEIAGDGVYLFLVPRRADPRARRDQKAALESAAFSTWYTTQKDASTSPAIPRSARRHRQLTRRGRPDDAGRAPRRGPAPLGARPRRGLAVVVAERLVATPVEPSRSRC